ncbi:alpha/beta hydrolase [Pseudoruegeria sp. HB172150]|uniref:alpha/beta hydrolase n=1 Tax=Pseudoruegeria sp. HB172150 TaxID=2721164 RepID=UPI0015526C8B|nr:alpha/beta hydrolase [Pseudoruegeria sp. HB172150]
MWKKILLVIVVLAVGISAYFIIYHPPVRLMPPPVVFELEGERIIEAAPTLVEDDEIEIFYATNRMPVGGSYTIAPDRSLRVGTGTLRIGEEGTTLDQLKEWTTRGDSGDRPYLHLVDVNEMAVLEEDSDPSVAAGWFAQINAALDASLGKDIMIFIHGANTTVERAAGHASQLQHYSGREAVVVLFTWPTMENFLRYFRDIRNASDSAKHLARLVELLTSQTSAERIDIFSYSSGGTVASDGLGLLAREDAEAADKLGEVVHVAPDADFQQFVEDLKLYAPLADSVTTILNLGDSTLRLAQVINRESRAGRPDLRELTEEEAAWILEAADENLLDVIQIRPEDLPNVTTTSHTFWYDSSWVGNDLILNIMLGIPIANRVLTEATAPSGTRYWTFPPDYPEAFAAALDALAAEVGGATGGDGAAETNADNAAGEAEDSDATETEAEDAAPEAPASE